VVAYSRWSQPDVRLYHEKNNAIQRVCFFNSTLKRVFTFVSPLFVWYTFLLGYMDCAKKEYNRQSRKPSTSGTERTLYLVVDFIFLSDGMLANYLIITRSRSNCTTNCSDISRYRVERVFIHFLFTAFRLVYILLSYSLLRRRSLGSSSNLCSCGRKIA
jgi:hypothetical protein